MEKKFIILLVIVIIIVALFAWWQSTQPEKEKKVEEKESSLLDVKERGTLIVGADIPYGVMEFFDESGKVVGVDADIVKEIASQLGVVLEYKDYDWEPLFDAIKSGEIDFAASALTITPEREKEMRFSVPYFNGGQTIIIKADNNKIKLPDDLSDKKIGVQIETTGHYAIKKYTTDDKILTYDTYESEDPESGMLYDLKSGKSDAIVLDYIAAVTIVKDNPSLKIAGDPFTQEFYGFASKKGRDSLMNEVDRILRDMKRDGQLKEIQDKWTK